MRTQTQDEGLKFLNFPTVPKSGDESGGFAPNFWIGYRNENDKRKSPKEFNKDNKESFDKKLFKEESN